LYFEMDEEWRARASTYLDGYGFSVVPALSVAEVYELLNAHRFSGVILDTALPSIDGASLVRDVSLRFGVPIIVTSSHDEEAERILALEAGADHYLTKPLGLRDLVAHVRAACRHSDRAPAASGASRVARFDGWSVDLPAHRAGRPERTVDLTPGETGILRAFLEHPFRVFSRAQLIGKTRRDDGEVFDRTVDVLISRLRHKLERDPMHPIYIQTIRGEGYRFAIAVSWDVLAPVAV
jgi:DNA-binding response OmpR family regulator